MKHLPFLEPHFRQISQQEAIICHHQSYSYQQLEESIANWQKELETTGSFEGKVVAIKSDFTLESVSLFLFLITQNAIIVPITKDSANLSERIEISHADFLFDLSKKEKIDILKFEPTKNELIEELRNRNHPGIVIFSSGTTGSPKAAIHDFTFLLEKYNQPGKAYRSIIFLLFDHWGGINTLLHILSKGGTACFIDSRDPDDICHYIQTHKIDLLPATPSFLNLILLKKSFLEYDLSSLKLITYGTEPMPEFTLKALHEALPKISLKQTYGLTELGVMKTKSKANDSLWLKLNDENYQIKIENDILFIKTKSSILGYLNAASPFDEEGWYNTGDKVICDGDWMKILGRESDMINVGGQKVFPSEIESFLMECPIVGDCTVYGEKNPFTGMHVACDIIPSEDNEWDKNEFRNQIKSFCKNKLEAYKIPVRINIVDQSNISERFKKIRKREY